MATNNAAATATIPAGRPSTPLFSADSHVIENSGLWSGVLPDGFFPSAPNRGGREGRVDPVARVDEMAKDGVEGEILYPTLGLRLFGLDDAAVQEKAFATYNSWMCDFCAVNPTKLYGLGLIAAYDMGHAVKEIERCAEGGLCGIEIWQSPHPDLPFTGRHYEPLWEAASSLGLPVSIHILTGFNYSREPRGGGTDSLEKSIDLYRGSVNLKLAAAADSLLEILFSGVLDRHPDLKVVLVENEIGWLPFLFDQFDYYTDRFKDDRPTAMARRPSEYFGSQVFSTFFRDPVGMKMLGWWGADGCMWSNDYPHPNSTWPHSQEVVAKNLGHLDEEKFEKVVRATARALYRLDEVS